MFYIYNEYKLFIVGFVKYFLLLRIVTSNADFKFGAIDSGMVNSFSLLFILVLSVMTGILYTIPFSSPLASLNLNVYEYVLFNFIVCVTIFLFFKSFINFWFT